MAERPIRRVSSRYNNTPRGPRNRKPGNRKARSHWFRNSLLLLLGVGGFFLFSYLGYLDYQVRTQFEGKRWAIPARVYGNPVELYAGHGLSAGKFENLLEMLHYRKDSSLAAEGTYVRNGGQISVKTRAFTFWDQPEPQPAVAMRVDFSDAGIQNITDLSTHETLAIVRMDPVQIGSFYPTIKEDRVLIKLEEAPDMLIKGLLASEDRDFYDHFGVSLRGILRAMVANIQAGDMVQGGSTITQQLVKNFYLTSERKLARKIKEALMALILEYRYSKNEILEAYLNEIYLGQDGASAVHGFGLASQFYFGSPLKDLSLPQVASLVALVRGPSQYNPRRFVERALQRRNLVLDEMAAQNYISAQQATAAKAAPLGVISGAHGSANRYPAFLDLVKRQLRQDYREEDLTSEGLRIFTTLDTQIQDVLEAAIQRKLPQLEKHPQARKLESAVVVTRKDSGEIAALAGGRDDSSAGFNRALDAVRPIGSLIKPVIYLTALQFPRRYTITTPVSDSAIFVKGDHGNDWSPKNYDHREHGTIGLHTALAKSYNLATVRVGLDVGIGKIAKTLKDLGVTREVELYPSFLLGAAQLAPIEVAQMYQTLAGDGFLTPIKAIKAVVSANGEKLQSYPYAVRQTVDPSSTYILNTILQEVMHAGTGSTAYSVFPQDFGLVGKTGTTNDAKDSWFAGFTGDYLSVVWVGRDDNKPAGLTGSTGALQVWTSFMRQIAKAPVTLTPPDNIRMVKIDPYSGLVAGEGCTGKVYPYIAGSEPTAYSTCGNTIYEQDRPWFEEFFPDSSDKADAQGNPDSEDDE